MICYWDKFDSEIGLIQLVASDKGLIYCASPRINGRDMETWISKNLIDCTLKKANHPILKTAKSQLESYFAGESKLLDVPLELIGTDFRKSVWKALLTIPYGETRSYVDIARQIGNPKAARAVGQANNKNPISYFVP